MPLYVYEARDPKRSCGKCKDGFEIVQKLSDPKLETCPDCGAPMRKRVARKGANAGHPFWSCTKWPACKGTMPC